MGYLGLVTTLAGQGSLATTGTTDGFGTNAKFKIPYGVAINPLGTLLYVTDAGNNNIRSIILSSGN
jgi:DNA-binding beta-propeller fold protein YncE